MNAADFANIAERRAAVRLTERGELERADRAWRHQGPYPRTYSSLLACAATARVAVVCIRLIRGRIIATGVRDAKGWVTHTAHGSYFQHEDKGTRPAPVLIAPSWA